MTARRWMWYRDVASDGAITIHLDSDVYLELDEEASLGDHAATADWIVAALNEKEAREGYGVLGVVQARTDFDEQSPPVASS